MAELTRSQDMRQELMAMIIESEKRQDAKMEVLLAELKNLSSHLSKGNEKVGEENSDAGSIPRMHRREETLWGSAIRLEFPRFEGERLEGWLLRAEHFFEVGNVAPESRVKVAALHLEGRALLWHQSYIKLQGVAAYEDWNGYVKAIESRFGSRAFEDPIVEFVESFQCDKALEFVEFVALPSQALPATPPGHMAIRSTTVILSGPLGPRGIDTMTLFVLDGGCAFERSIMKRGRVNPLFNLLFELGSKKHAYYVRRLYSFAPKNTLQRWRTEHFIVVFDRGKSIQRLSPQQGAHSMKKSR